MRARPMLLPFLGHSFRDAAHGQAGGIRGDNRAGLANFRDAGEQRALDFEIFGDDFDDPVRLGAKIQVIFKIAGDDAIFETPGEKRGGLGLDRGCETRANDAITNVGIFQGQPALLLRGRELSRRDIQQGAPDAGVGNVRAMRAPMVPAPKTTTFSIDRFVISVRLGPPHWSVNSLAIRV